MMMSQYGFHFTFESFFSHTIAACAFPRPWQMMFQAPSTIMMNGIIDLHHDIMAILAFILGFVMTLLLTGVFLFKDRETGQTGGSDYYFYRRQHYHSGHGITYHTTLETI